MINLSIFLPYSPEIVISTFTTWFSLDLTTLTSAETLIITLITNAYFFGFWFFILYFTIKGFYKIYQNLF